DGESAQACRVLRPLSRAELEEALSRKPGPEANLRRQVAGEVEGYRRLDIPAGNQGILDPSADVLCCQRFQLPSSSHADQQNPARRDPRNRKEVQMLPALSREAARAHRA